MRSSERAGAWCRRSGARRGRRRAALTGLEAGLQADVEAAAQEVVGRRVRERLAAGAGDKVPGLLVEEVVDAATQLEVVVDLPLRLERRVPGRVDAACRADRG